MEIDDDVGGAARPPERPRAAGGGRSGTHPGSRHDDAARARLAVGENHLERVRGSEVSTATASAHPLLAHLPEHERRKVLVTLDEASLTVEEWAARRSPLHAEWIAGSVKARAEEDAREVERVALSDAASASDTTVVMDAAERTTARAWTAPPAPSASLRARAHVRAAAAEGGDTIVVERRRAETEEGDATLREEADRRARSDLGARGDAPRVVEVDDVEVREQDVVEGSRAATRTQVRRGSREAGEAVRTADDRERGRSTGAFERLPPHHRRTALRAAALADVPVSLWLEQAVIAQARAGGVSMGFEADAVSTEEERDLRRGAEAGFQDFPGYLRRLLVRAAAAADVPPSIWFEQAVLEQARLDVANERVAGPWVRPPDRAAGRVEDDLGIETLIEEMPAPHRRLAERAAARAELPTSIWLERAIVERAQAERGESAEPPSSRPRVFQPFASTRGEETLEERGGWRGRSGWELIAAVAVGVLLATALLLLSPLVWPGGKVRADVVAVAAAASAGAAAGAGQGGAHVTVANVVLTPSAPASDRGWVDRTRIYREVDRSRSRRTDDIVFPGPGPGSVIAYPAEGWTADCGCRPVDACATCTPDLDSLPSMRGPIPVDAPA